MTTSLLPDAIARARFDASALVREHPPRVRHRAKRLLLDLAGTTPPRGAIDVARWRALELPEAAAGATIHEHHEDVYAYAAPAAGDDAWHVNFADAHLFAYYDGPLFAQDELQVAEHPALASVREALRAHGAPHLLAMTRDVDGAPTPVTVRNVERRIAVDTTRIYGNQLASSSDDAIRAAVTPLEPPTTSHILAIDAPSGGRGAYQRATIVDALVTATTGFAAARAETARAAPGTRCVIHTGNWGCGAYGGDRVLMALVQILAAHLAGVDRLVFHTFRRDFTAGYTAARTHAEQLLRDPAALVDAITGLGFRWGESNGT